MGVISKVSYGAVAVLCLAAVFGGSPSDAGDASAAMYSVLASAGPTASTASR